MRIPVTDAELAILSLVVEEERYGYEIERIIDERGMRDWTDIGFSSIYYVLKRLEKNGWITSRLQVAPGKGPARRLYTITPEGQAAWRQATLEALANPVRCNMPFLQGLANLPGLPQADTVTAVQQYHERLVERHEHVQVRRRQLGPSLPYHVEAMFDLSLALIQAELEWVARFIQQLTGGGRLHSKE
jgi:DNA-binding PadR family transcriptional regulator